jgi:hypothetical protein
MNLVVAIVGERWEACFARRTARSLAAWLTESMEIVVPWEYERFMTDVCPRQPRVLDPAPTGFQSYQQVRERTLAQVGQHQGALLLFAGTVPATAWPVKSLGPAFKEDRVVEWISGPVVGSQTRLHFARAPHRPPVDPRHEITRVGKLDLWSVDTGEDYFQALMEMAPSKEPAIWPQYGCSRPVFVYNTNDFDERAVARHEDYFILGSGLLGLRMVAESQPRAGARVVVYDINPDQLLWIQFVLDHARDTIELDRLIEAFQAEYPAVLIRSVLRHERENAHSQQDWYRRRRLQIAELTAQLEWEFVACDLMTDPLPVLNRIRQFRSLFFMYLDLFVIWQTDHEPVWVERYPAMAESLERVVRERAQRLVSFLPRSDSESFQLQRGSPFA